MSILLTLLACTSNQGSIIVEAGSLNWDTVDFQQEIPADGYQAKQVLVTNNSRLDLDVSINNFDTDHLILGALLIKIDPPTMSLSAAEQIIITIGVGGYLDGERDTTVSGSFNFDAEQLLAPTYVDWSFIPVREFEDDTGL